MRIFATLEKTIEREFRRWTQKVFGPAESDQLLLLRRAVLDSVETKIETVGRGKRIFPYEQVIVRLGSTDPARQQLLLRAFGEERRLEKDVRDSLAGVGCDIPLTFRLDVEIDNEPRRFVVTYHVRPLQSEHIERDAQRPSRLVVVRGKANQDSFAINKSRTNIGRLTELTDERQRIIRRNDIVFEEGSDEANATVSRAHAHIVFNSHRSEYRICDDSSEYGTRLFRTGRSIEVPTGQRGESLQTGDEIFLGRACLRFEWSDPT